MNHAVRLLLLAWLLVVGGCAEAYHHYACGCVPYGYCAPAPLAHTQYSDPVCRTPPQEPEAATE